MITSNTPRKTTKNTVLVVMSSPPPRNRSKCVAKCDDTKKSKIDTKAEREKESA